MKNLFKEIDALLQGRNKESKKYAKATYWLRHEDSISLRYHETDVVTIFPNGKIVLNSGGWRSMTTKQRINDVLPSGFYLSQDKGQWFLHKRNDNTYVFKDGLVIGAKGKVYAALRSEKKDKQKVKHSKKVNAFAKEMVERAFDGRMPAPSNGDCWYCLMKTEEGKTWGDTSSSDHIQQHIKEKYYVPSLFWNAMEEGRDYLATIAHHNLAVLQQNQNNGSSEHEYMMLDVVKDQYYKVLRKYLRKRLGLTL